jgi:uncharacterized integral membrane protein
MSEQKSLFHKIRLWVMVALAVVVLIIVFQNLEPQKAQILIWEFTMPQSALIFGALAVGYGLGVLTAGRLLGRRK